MYSHEFFHTLLSDALPEIHSKRLTAVMNAVQSLIKGKTLTLTQLGRNMNGFAKERHNIRKMDRLLANTTLHSEIICFYAALAQELLSSLKSIVISVDWAATDKRKDLHILRASITTKGRGQVVYQEVHPASKVNNHIVHKRFLQRLRHIIPAEVHATILTDAGYIGPWFMEVERLGFDYIGRSCKTIFYTPNGEENWQKTGDLYASATSKAKSIGKCLFTKTNKLPASLVTYREKAKGRTHRTRRGKRSENSHCQRIAKQQRRGWILVTSLDVDDVGAEKIVKLYKQRMQIEEDFRDTKSHQYGFGLRYSLSRCPKRMEVLLLIAALATWICRIVSIVARQKNLHLNYQANTIKTRRVLSDIYLGRRLLIKGFTIAWAEVNFAVKELRQIIGGAALCL